MLQTVKSFREIWERTENENLTKDRDLQLKIHEEDKDFIENEAAKLQDEEDRWVDEALRIEIEKEEENQPDEEMKDLIQR